MLIIHLIEEDIFGVSTFSRPFLEDTFFVDCMFITGSATILVATEGVYGP
jgi:hypothetical protein